MKSIQEQTDMKPTIESLNLVRKISESVDTFHHHYHILHDIATQYYGNGHVRYVEIGAYAGGSACLMLQRPNTSVVSIDIGYPIDPQIVKKNTHRHLCGNKYQYIIGDSGNISTKEELKTSIDGSIDILFIDGDHSYSGVQRDFAMYEDLLSDDGFIVFDDYNDSKWSPEVKKAVDDLIPDIVDRYSIIGTAPNILEAKPKEIVDGNCFVIRRKA